MHSDGKNLPYTEAVIHEIHRHATISYISVNHAPMYDTTYSGYNFLRTDMITPCLFEVRSCQVFVILKSDIVSSVFAQQSRLKIVMPNDMSIIS